MIKDFLSKFTVQQTKKQPDGDVEFDDGAEEEVDAEDEPVGTLRYSNLLVSDHQIANHSTDTWLTHPLAGLQQQVANRETEAVEIRLDDLLNVSPAGCGLG